MIAQKLIFYQNYWILVQNSKEWMTYVLLLFNVLLEVLAS